MKFLSKKITGLLVIALLALCLTGFAKAQEMATQISSVIKAQQEIDAYINRAYNNSTKGGEELLSSTSTPIFGCDTGYTSWPSSSTPTMEPSWSNFTRTNLVTNSNELVADLNGDGLSDYAYLERVSNEPAACIYLNNGTGFDLVYRCKKVSTTWYGDCADVS